MDARMNSPMKKSMKAAVMVAVGMIIRGKYTLLTKPVFVMRLLEASDNPVAKNVQGNIPANTMSA
jgi:hypothetical protein